MKLHFQNVFIISETIRRPSLTEYFWPLEQQRFGRKKLIDLNKREGWVCHFVEKGLGLDAKLIISKEDYTEWPQQHRTLNANTIKSELTFHDQIEFEFSTPALTLQHLAADAEPVRKTVYISERYGERADGIWAAQYFPPAADRNTMYYNLGFTRETQPEDLHALNLIRSALSGLENVTLL